MFFKLLYLRLFSPHSALYLPLPLPSYRPNTSRPTLMKRNLKIAQFYESDARQRTASLLAILFTELVGKTGCSYHAAWFTRG